MQKLNKRKSLFVLARSGTQPKLCDASTLTSKVLQCQQMLPSCWKISKTICQDHICSLSSAVLSAKVLFKNHYKKRDNCEACSFAKVALPVHILLFNNQFSSTEVSLQLVYNSKQIYLHVSDVHFPVLATTVSMNSSNSMPGMTTLNYFLPPLQAFF